MDEVTVLAICYNPAFEEYLKRVEPNMKLHFIHKPYEYIATDEDLVGIEHIDVCFGNHLIFHEIINKYPSLKWFHSLSAGNECSMDVLRKLKQRPIYTRNCTVIDVTIPQFILAHILNHERNILEMYENQKKRVWMDSKNLRCRQINTVTVGILGLGVIGKPAAKLCKTLTMKVWAMTRGVVPLEQRESYVDEYRQASDLEDVLTNCDYIVNILPSTTQTRGLLNGNTLSKCKKKPVFINVGRGDIIDEQTIISALRNGWISKAVLDVFEIEPLPTSSQLWHEPGVIISPHTAYGLYPTEDCEQVAQAFLDNYHRFLKGQTLIGQVSIENGY